MCIQFTAMMDDQFCEKNLPWTWYKSAEEKYKPQIKFSGQFNLLIETVVEDRQQCGLFGNVCEQKRWVNCVDIPIRPKARGSCLPVTASVSIALLALMAPLFFSFSLSVNVPNMGQRSKQTMQCN